MPPVILVVPLAVKPPVIFNPLLKSNSSLASSQSILAAEPSITIPEPPDNPSDCPLPSVIVLSVTSRSVTEALLMSPVIFKSPATVKSPVNEAFPLLFMVSLFVPPVPKLVEAPFIKRSAY